MLKSENTLMVAKQIMSSSYLVSCLYDGLSLQRSMDLLCFKALKVVPNSYDDWSFEDFKVDVEKLYDRGGYTYLKNTLKQEFNTCLEDIGIDSVFETIEFITSSDFTDCVFDAFASAEPAYALVGGDVDVAFDALTDAIQGVYENEIPKLKSVFSEAGY